MGVPLPEEGVRRSNRGRSQDRRDVWVGLKPTERLPNEPWSSMQGQLKRNEENALQSERRSALKKILTGPTLLEMSGSPCQLNRSLRHSLIGSSDDVFQRR